MSEVCHTTHITRFIYARTREREKRDSSFRGAYYDSDVTVLVCFIVIYDVPFSITSFYDVIQKCVCSNDKGIITAHAIGYHLSTRRKTEKTHKNWKREYVNQN